MCGIPSYGSVPIAVLWSGSVRILLGQILWDAVFFG
jgi:hypothetical protein